MMQKKTTNKPVVIPRELWDRLIMSSAKLVERNRELEEEIAEALTSPIVDLTHDTLTRILLALPRDADRVLQQIFEHQAVDIPACFDKPRLYVRLPRECPFYSTTFSYPPTFLRDLGRRAILDQFTALQALDRLGRGGHKHRELPTELVYVEPEYPRLPHRYLWISDFHDLRLIWEANGVCRVHWCWRKNEENARPLDEAYDNAISAPYR